MSFYRVSLLDRNGVVVTSQTCDSMMGVAGMLAMLGTASSEEWAKPYLDEYGELTVSITRAGGAPLLDGQMDHIMDLVREAGGVVPESLEEIGVLRWNNPERQT